MRSVEGKTIQGFSPIIPAQPKILVLGTMPSVKSLEDAFYYAHPRNAFWPMIEYLTRRSLRSLKDKVQALDALNILLWDVLANCEREGSLDSAIKQPVANNFEALLSDYPEIQVVVFNGQAAEKLFKQQVLNKQNLPAGITFLTLPSTSPANARLKIKDKCLIWEEKLANFL